MITASLHFSVENKFYYLCSRGRGLHRGLVVDEHVALDAIPDLSETQVIIFSRWDRSRTSSRTR